jgi:hypothetical protein
VRLIANELHHLGWRATVLTVDERDYEEPADMDGVKLVAPEVEVIKVRASPIRRFIGMRLIGDIGLRAFGSLKREAVRLCLEEQVDFAWISMPSWYPALIGRFLHNTGTPFGIDYQDPWVYDLPENVSPLSRELITIQIAKALEPFAVKHASVITGINQPYFQGVLDRNPHLESVSHGSFQLGFSHRDHSIKMPHLQTPWKRGERPFVYAGAFLPKSLVLWEQLFRALALLKKEDSLDPTIRIHLFGTKQSHHRSLSSMATDVGIGDLIIEHPERIPFLQVQELIRRAEGVLSVGSTEPHYSASKTFQCLLSGKKLFSYFHRDSEARIILKDCEADAFHTSFHSDELIEDQVIKIKRKLCDYFSTKSMDWSPNLQPLEAYNSRKSAEALIQTVEKALKIK